MKLKIYQVDAFTEKVFGGNPAAVIPLDEWLDDKTMQKIANENNLSETAFIFKEREHYKIRWFTPANEVPLCGHATLASSFVIFNFLQPDLEEIKFDSASGELFVAKKNNLIELNFPSNTPVKVEHNSEITEVIGFEPEELYFNRSYIAVLKDESSVRNLKPDITKLSRLDFDGLIVTAKGDEVDFVSRYFVPQDGIDEDPVTGYAHTLLTPLWADKLHKNEMHALQVSKRGGELFVKNMYERVLIAGNAVLYFTGEIDI